MANYILYTDGGARGNPGIAGAGIVIKDGAGTVLHEASKPLGEATNNEAEYQAVIFGLETLKDFVGEEKVRGATINLHLDSELIARQITKKYKIKEDRLRRLCEMIWALRDDLSLNLEVTEVRREQNQDADRLANEAMDLGLRGIV